MSLTSMYLVAAAVWVGYDILLTTDREVRPSYPLARVVEANKLAV